MTTKRRLEPRSSIFQLEVGASGDSGIASGDIIDVVASLGHAGDSILVDATYGDATIRLNVTQETFGRQDPNHWYEARGNPMGAFWDRPVSSGLIEVDKTDIVVASGVQFSINDTYFTDFKAVSVANGVRITFH